MILTLPSPIKETLPSERQYCHSNFYHYLNERMNEAFYLVVKENLHLFHISHVKYNAIRFEDKKNGITISLENILFKNYS